MKNLCKILLLTALLLGCSNMLGDVVPPVPGGGGVIHSVVTGSDPYHPSVISVSWEAATDDTPESSGVVYDLYISEVKDMDTASEVLQNGTYLGRGHGDFSFDSEDMGLIPGKTYYINVLVTDPAGNRSVYSTLEITIPHLVITPTGQTDREFGLNWHSEPGCEYKVVISTSDNITSLEEADITADGNGKVIVSDFVPGLDHVEVKGLTPGETYYYNVIVKDPDGNKTVLKSGEITTLTVNGDTLPPLPGGGNGTVSVWGKDYTEISLSWLPGEDSKTPQAELKYRVVYSVASDDVQNPEALFQAEEEGRLSIAAEWTPLMCESTVTDLSEGQEYHFAVLVKDSSGNISLYEPLSETTLEDSHLPPVPGSGSQGGTSHVKHSELSDTGVKLSWDPASDDQTEQGSLKYKVVISTGDSEGKNNIASLDETETPGEGRQVVLDWTPGVTSFDVDGLDPETDYYYTVIVVDHGGNKSLYTGGQIRTEDSVAPAAGGSKGSEIRVKESSGTGFILEWDSASDKTTASHELEYLVVLSENDNLNNLSDPENLPVGAYPVKPWTPGITEESAEGLEPETVYYYTVFVRDAKGNTAVYQSGRQRTQDTAAPETGLITLENRGVRDFYISWPMGRDKTTSPLNLMYKVVLSTDDNLSEDLFETLTEGRILVQDWTQNLTETEVFFLEPETLYYYNVMIKDEAGNRALYTQGSVVTEPVRVDNQSPEASDRVLVLTAQSEGSVTLSWSEATDHNTVYYKVMSSPVNNLANPEDSYNADGSRVNVMNWKAGVYELDIRGLTPGDTYYFNVYARDENNNLTAYTSQAYKVPDNTAPVPGDRGISDSVEAVSVSISSMTLTWDEAGDNSGAELLYKGVLSLHDDVHTELLTDIASDTSEKWVFLDWSTGITSVSVTDLKPGTDYWFNVLVKDREGNTALYNRGQAVTPSDSEAPLPGETLTPGDADIMSTGINLSWNRASDNYTLQRDLEYKVVESLTGGIVSPDEAEAPTTGKRVIAEWTKDMISLSVDSLIPVETYIYYILVRDGAGNRALYPEVILTTKGDFTPPVLPADKRVTAVVQEPSDLKLTWNPASDDVSQNLLYKVVVSEHNRINTLSEADVSTSTPGIVYAGSWISRPPEGVIIPSLTPGVQLWYNIIVKDEAGNRSLYSMGAVLIPSGDMNITVELETLTEDIVMNDALRGYTLTIDIPGDYVLRQWMINGGSLNSVSGTGFQVDLAPLEPGTHWITVIVTKDDGTPYSRSIYFTKANKETL